MLADPPNKLVLSENGLEVLTVYELLDFSTESYNIMMQTHSI